MVKLKVPLFKEIHFRLVMIMQAKTFIIWATVRSVLLWGQFQKKKKLNSVCYGMYSYTGQCKTQTADCRPGVKSETEVITELLKKPKPIRNAKLGLKQYLRLTVSISNAFGLIFNS